jgi:hypothetical protein
MNLIDLLDCYSANSADENPQTPQTIDITTQTNYKFAILHSDSDETREQVIFVDPDRPPITKADVQRIKNQKKSKAKK